MQRDVWACGGIFEPISGIFDPNSGILKSHFRDFRSQFRDVLSHFRDSEACREMFGDVEGFLIPFQRFSVLFQGFSIPIQGFFKSHFKDMNGICGIVKRVRGPGTGLKWTNS